MLKPKYIETLPSPLVWDYSDVETSILEYMAKRILAFDDFIPASQWQYQKLIEMGNYHSFIVQCLHTRVIHEFLNVGTGFACPG